MPYIYLIYINYTESHVILMSYSMIKALLLLLEIESKRNRCNLSLIQLTWRKILLGRIIETMRKFILGFFLVLGIVILSAGVMAAEIDGTVATSGPSLVQGLEKVVVVVLENTNYEDSFKQSFMTNLIKKGALLSNYFGITHPSQPNYIAMVAGSILSVQDNRPVSLSQRHLGNLVEEKGKTWKTYAEGYPGGCFLGVKKGAYVRKHNPFISFKDVQTSPSRCARVVNGLEFWADLKEGSLPHLSFYIPDLNNDGHDTGVMRADQWLAEFFRPIFESKELTKNTLFVVTFDEDSGSGNNRIATVFFGDRVLAGAISMRRYDHYSLLRTIEEVLGLSTLGRYDVSAPVIDDIWR